MTRATGSSIFDDWLLRWNLRVDGEPISTHCSDLLPVRFGAEPAMLKIAREPDTRWAWLLMEYWGGEGAARVFAHDGDALLLERAMGTRSLARMTYDGRDDEAIGILCAAAARLHAPRPRPRPDQLLPLREWFAPLAPAARAHGGVLARADAVASELFARPREPVTLHGDLHHENVLDGAERGWLAIDPMRLYGERGFDFVNLMRNPDPHEDIGLKRERFARRVDLIVEAAGIERERLLQWTLAFAGLSAAWILGDGDEPAADFAVAGMALAELG